MNKATRAVELTAGTIVVTATADLSDRVINADGHKVVSGKNLHETLKIEAVANGKVLESDSQLIWTDPNNKWDAERVSKGIVARFGKVGLKADSAKLVSDAIDAATAEVNTADIAEHKAVIAAAREADSAADERHAKNAARIQRAMDA